MNHRFGKAVGVVAGCALVLGTIVMVGGQMASAHSTGTKYKTVGFAPGTIGDDGSFSATVDGTGNGGASSTTTITGQLATGTGIGNRGAAGQTALSEGAFSASFTSTQRSTSGPDASGTISGTVTPSNPSPVATDMTYSFDCAVTYPPLAVQCTVTLRWTGPASS
ncbi:MAG: hypothetical protein ACLQPH_02360 [Acidimicrobiales bacterium]